MRRYIGRIYNEKVHKGISHKGISREGISHKGISRKAKQDVKGGIEMLIPKNNIISLIGMTGCGKSSVGRILAAKLGAVLVDLDDEITAKGENIKKIFSEQGEAAFRELEYGVLCDVISRTGGALTVLSCGGGVPTYEPSRQLLREKTTVIWLKRSVESVTANESVLMRPPVNGDVNNYRRLLDARYPIYMNTADYSFYNAFPGRTATAIIKKLELKKKES